MSEFKQIIFCHQKERKINMENYFKMTILIQEFFLLAEFGEPDSKLHEEEKFVIWRQFANGQLGAEDR